MEVKKPTAEINLMKKAVHVVKGGKLHEVVKPGSGQGNQIINWRGNKPRHTKLEMDIRF
ncbi:DUF3954 domain-containing protein [Domibacillus robiginosus]|uniref:DUF3954 domain-containing protein n=1 Tax=Domibacillus robiginosus TaxID=1071054 RepID=UPI000ADF30E0|nr:DUF3954 domain-containing protein [Domibacillus robiginosus]